MTDSAFFDELIGHEQLKKRWIHLIEEGRVRHGSGPCVSSCRTKSIATHRFFSTRQYDS